jgi:Holliday junction resolvase RusA-like endonuclease
MIILEFDIKGISKDNEKCRSSSGRYYLSSQYKAFEGTLKMLARAQLNRIYPDFKMFEKDVIVQLQFYFKDKRHCDTFNLPKSVCDAMTGILYRDDKQIKAGAVERVYTNKEAIRLFIEEADNGHILLQSLT